MGVEVLARKRTVASFRCDGCGLRWRRRVWEGPPPGWRRVRAGQALADLCRGCQAIGVWRDLPAAAAIEQRALHARQGACLAEPA